MHDDELAAEANGQGTVPYLLRLPAVLQVTGLGRSTLYKLIAERAFPEPVKIAKRAVAWRNEEVQRWSAGRPRAYAARGTTSRRS